MRASGIAGRSRLLQEWACRGSLCWRGLRPPIFGVAAPPRQDERASLRQYVLRAARRRTRRIDNYRHRLGFAAGLRQTRTLGALPRVSELSRRGGKRRPSIRPRVTRGGWAGLSLSSRRVLRGAGAASGRPAGSVTCATAASSSGAAACLAPRRKEVAVVATGSFRAVAVSLIPDHCVAKFYSSCDWMSFLPRESISHHSPPFQNAGASVTSSRVPPR